MQVGTGWRAEVFGAAAFNPSKQEKFGVRRFVHGRSTTNSVSSYSTLSLLNRRPTSGISPKNGTRALFPRSRLRIKPATASVWLSRNSTCVLKLRVSRLGTSVPPMSAALASSRSLMSAKTFNRTRLPTVTIGMNCNRTPKSMKATVCTALVVKD
jgi:hypothetical protein